MRYDAEKVDAEKVSGTFVSHNGDKLTDAEKVSGTVVSQNGDKLMQTDPLGRVTSWTYDEMADAEKVAGTIDCQSRRPTATGGFGISLSTTCTAKLRSSG